MLKTRLIPTLLWKDYGLVKGVGFDSWRRVGTVMPSIKVYNTRNVDELILLDITATENEREPDYESITEFAEECFVPLTYGGGVSKIEHIQKLLKSGADKVSINSAAFRDKRFIRDAAQYFGSQCIVGSIDAKKNDEGIYECYSNCGAIPTGQEPGVWAQELEALGAGEILITSIVQDGSMKGYDIELIKSVTSEVAIPVIASGGAGKYEDLYTALHLGKASAVAAASIFHFTQQTPREAKDYLASRGIPVRNIKIYQERAH